MNIVVGVTSRPESQVALERAIEEAELRGARLVVVRTMGEGLSENPAQNQAWQKKVDAARAEGEQLVEQLAERGIEAENRVEPVSRDAAAVLLETAKSVDAGLLVIGFRRRSPVGKLVLGSVSQDVLLGAECPVLAVKAADED